MAITVSVSVAGHVLIAGIYNYLLPLPFHFPLPSTITSAGHSSLPGGVTQTFISEGSGPLTNGPDCIGLL